MPRRPGVRAPGQGCMSSAKSIGDLRLCPDEGQVRRKAPDRKHRMAVSRFQPLRRRTEGGDKLRVETVELLADRSAEGVKARVWRLLRALGLRRRILPQDGLGPERLLSTPLSLCLGLRLD